ncbi:MAG: 1-acyl-sn-glycerol-3-phosphate acyltransferase [Coriobacteriia bacterium]|nr:1-acyl-sn-glycerol-3-phosphate acyltransferase [Coriobacteriia bacterium]
MRFAFRTRLTGAENIPAGGAILAGNHVSYLDPILLWCASPRPVHFMAKRELWESRVIAWGLPRLWAFPVSRGEPDRTAIMTAADLLNAGELVGVFPEGHRSADGAASMGEAHGGAAFIALRAGVPIVPIAFVGTEKVWPRGARCPRPGRTFIHVGKPLFPMDVLREGKRKQRVEEITAQLMKRIADLLDEARGAVS